MFDYFEMLKREDGCIGFGRVLAFIIFLVWLGITISMFVLDKRFPEYSTLSYTMMASVFSVICGKWVDLKK